MQILVFGSETRVCNATECVIAAQGHFRVNQKRSLILVPIESAYSISHRFGDTVAYWSKIANSYPPHPHSTPSPGVTPSDFGMINISPETRMMELSYDEEIMMADGRSNLVDTVNECDRRTDRQTDRRTNGRADRITITKTVQRIASHFRSHDIIHSSCLMNTLNTGSGAYTAIFPSPQIVTSFCALQGKVKVVP